MDEAAAVEAIKEDGAETRPHDADEASENNVGSSAEDTVNVDEFSHACEDCGLKFTNLDVFKTHLHQHAMEEEDEEEGEEEDDDEEEAENAQTGDDPGRGYNGKNEDGCEISSSTGSVQGVGVASGRKIPNGFACSVCGKVYSYWVSFQKHQQLHEDKSSSATKSQSEQILRTYDCPECGKSFFRRARLRGHLRVHRVGKLKSTPGRCDQCNKDFNSTKSWIAHIELHKQRPFWCLSCARGYIDEGSLDKHLQSHSEKQHTCNVCNKSFYVAARLLNHYKTHVGVKPYLCTLCGKGFSFPGNLMAHRRKHHRVKAWSARMKGFKKKRLVLASVKEEPEMETNMEELPREDENVEKSETQKLCEGAVCGDHAGSDESDCGEPGHDFWPSKPPGSAQCDPSNESESGPVETRAGQQLDGAHIHREHKYWEWECCECDMGFDEVEKLHLHYIKHATGELPILQDDF